MGRRTVDPSRTFDVLLVEDDRVDVMNVRRAFERADIACRVRVAGDGVEALRKLRNGDVPHDALLILLDLNLPRMGGIEFLEAMRGDDALSHIPVVVLSTSAAESDRARAYELNVAGYIVKPVTFAAFVDVVTTLHDYWTLVEMP